MAVPAPAHYALRPAAVRRPSMSIAIHLLGPPRVERDGIALPPPRGQKAWALLAYLLLCEGTPTRQQVAGFLFPDAEDALGALRWNLSELRRVLGPAHFRADGLTPVSEPPFYVDVRVLRRGSWVEALEVPAFGRELLEGMAFPSSPAFEVWLATQRRHLQAAVEAMLREAALARMASGSAREAADLAARLVLHNALDEGFQVLLVRALVAAGDTVGAARQAAACRELFERELGVPPGPALARALQPPAEVPVRTVSARGAALAQLEAGEAAIAAGATEAGLECLRRAVAEADAMHAGELRGRARVALGGALIRAARGRDEEGAAALHEVLAIDGCDPSTAAAAACELGYVDFLRGRYDRALAWLERAGAQAEGRDGEHARIASVRGATLSDTAHYGEAIRSLMLAIDLGAHREDHRQLAHSFSMLGRSHLLLGHWDAAADALDRSLHCARQSWAAFLPWPQSLRGEADLERGDVAAAQERFEEAFALSCQLGDPCWECMARRGLGRVAQVRGRFDDACAAFVDAIERSMRLPDAYHWAMAYALDALCALAVQRQMPQALGWVVRLQGVAERTGMRELVVRAHLHRARLGDTASAGTARLLALEIDNPMLASLGERSEAAP